MLFNSSRPWIIITTLSSSKTSNSSISNLLTLLSRKWIIIRQIISWISPLIHLTLGSTTNPTKTDKHSILSSNSRLCKETKIRRHLNTKKIVIWTQWVLILILSKPKVMPKINNNQTSTKTRRKIKTKFQSWQLTQKSKRVALFWSKDLNKISRNSTNYVVQDKASVVIPCTVILCLIVTSMTKEKL